MAEAPSSAAAQSLRTAQANIKRARDEVEEMLGHLDTARQVSAALCGPHTLMARCSHAADSPGSFGTAQSLAMSAAVADGRMQRRCHVLPLRGRTLAGVTRLRQ